MFLAMIVIYVDTTMKQCSKKYYETNLSPCGLSEEYVVPAWNVTHGGVLKISDSLSF